MFPFFPHFPTLWIFKPGNGPDRPKWGKFMGLWIKMGSNSIYTPLVSLHTPLLSTPQIKLFTPHFITKHSHPTLLTPHTRTQPASSVLFPQTHPPLCYPKLILEPSNPEIQPREEPSLHPPHPNPSSALFTKTHPTTPNDKNIK